jgi:hypothetical protein
MILHYVGWLRLPRGPWKPVCQDATASLCWNQLLAISAATAQSERVVLPCNKDPYGRPLMPDAPEDDLRQPGLFDSLDDHRRHQLRERGWHETGGIIHGRRLWRTPDGSAVLDEDEAFARLARDDQGKAGGT